MGNYLKYSLPLLSLFLFFLLFEPSPYSPPFPIFLSVIAPNFSSSTYARPTASNQRAASPADKLLADGDSRPSTEAHQRPWCNGGLREETGCLLQPAEVSSLCVHVCVCVHPSLTWNVSTDSKFTIYCNSGYVFSQPVVATKNICCPNSISHYWDREWGGPHASKASGFPLLFFLSRFYPLFTVQMEKWTSISS